MPNSHDRTGLLQYAVIPFNGLTSTASHSTYKAVEQMHIESIDYTAHTANTGAQASDTINFFAGIADNGSTFVSATNIDASEDVSMTVATQLIAAGTTIFFEIENVSTTASLGGAVTIKFKWDGKNELKEQ